jgi:hypothetical protein
VMSRERVVWMRESSTSDVPQMLCKGRDQRGGRNRHQIEEKCHFSHPRCKIER